MKKINLFFLIFCSLIFFSCAEDNLISPDYNNIQGKWFEDTKIENSQNYVQRLTYNFNLSNNTFEMERVVLDAKSNILGYRFYEVGYFNIKGSQLTITASKIYGLTEQPEPMYVSKDELKEIPLKSQSLKVEFQILFDVMTWKFPPCAPNANCIGAQMFAKAK